MVVVDVTQCDEASGDTAFADIATVEAGIEVAVCDCSLERDTGVGLGFSLLPMVNTLNPFLPPAFSKFSGSKTEKVP